MAVIKYLNERGLKTLAEEIKKRTSNIYTIKGAAKYIDADQVDATFTSTGVWQEVDGTWTKVASFTAGDVFNIENDFTTDVSFVEGLGKEVVAGTNIVVVNTGTAEAPVLKFDLLAMSLSLEAYQKKILTAPLTVFVADHTYATATDLPSDPDSPDTIEDLDIAILTDDAEKDDVYRASVVETSGGVKTLTWVKLGNQTTVEGSLELLSKTTPNTPISDTEIVALFE